MKLETFQLLIESSIHYSNNIFCFCFRFFFTFSAIFLSLYLDYFLTTNYFFKLTLRDHIVTFPFTAKEKFKSMKQFLIIGSIFDLKLSKIFFFIFAAEDFLFHKNKWSRSDLFAILFCSILFITKLRVTLLWSRQFSKKTWLWKNLAW